MPSLDGPASALCPCLCRLAGGARRERRAASVLMKTMRGPELLLALPITQRRQPCRRHLPLSRLSPGQSLSALRGSGGAWAAPDTRAAEQHSRQLGASR